MHDPQTLAFEIKSPFKNKRGYRESLIDIWHCDPENHRFSDGERKLGGRGDDSCGWYAPMYREAELKKIEELAKVQYQEIYARKVAEAKGEKSVRFYNQPETMYEVIYWIWRSIKAYGKKGWQYGNKKNFLSAGELEFIMQLATAPMDNFRNWTINNESDFIDMFRLIWIQYRRYHRPWYKHPRWHVHHWKINFPLLRDFNRKWFAKCDMCGKRGFRDTNGKRTSIAYGNWYGDRTWCPACNDNQEKMAPAPVLKNEAQ